MPTEVLHLSPKALKPHPRNSEFYDEAEGDAYETFKQSIQDNGILTPLLVTPDMTVISGHQRLRAALDLSLDAVPVIVDPDATTQESIVMHLIAANFGRMRNSPVKQAKLLQEYKRLAGIQRGGDPR